MDDPVGYIYLDIVIYLALCLFFDLTVKVFRVQLIFLDPLLCTLLLALNSPLYSKGGTQSQ